MRHVCLSILSFLFIKFKSSSSFHFYFSFFSDEFISFISLILQRFMPMPTNRRQLFRYFDPTIHTLGVVVGVKHIPEGANIYSIFPFCTDHGCPGELTLRTRKPLGLGHWIRIENQDLECEEINPHTWTRHGEWFATIPFLDQIAMECDILVLPQGKNGPFIRTATYKPLNNHKGPNTPFIQNIRAEKGTIGREHFNKKICATLEYNREDGHWVVTFVRPQGYSQQKINPYHP